MKTRTPTLPYSNIVVTHKPPRKEKVVPVKYDTEQRRCAKFYCTDAKSNICCGFCDKTCKARCKNNLQCNCLTDIMKGKSTLIIVGGG
jgi:hypothetical protein